MREVFAITDDDIKLKIYLTEDKHFIEFATDLFVLWDQSGKSLPLEERYEIYRQALSNRWGINISRATAYAVLGEVIETIIELKKNSSTSQNLKSLELTQEEEQKQS